MKPAVFQYRKAETTREALEALGTNPGAKVLAGGQSLVPLMNFRLSRPDVLVDINGIEELTLVEKLDQTLAIGALVRHSTLSQHPLIEREVPVLAEAARHIGHWAIRNRGTIGGSAVHADPAAELPAALVALRASVVVGAPRGERTMPADEFFLGYYTTALAQDELVMRFEIPLPARRMGFSEVVRRPGDFALVGAYVEDSDAEAAVTWFGLGAMPERQVVEAWPKGQDERQALLERLAREVQSDDEYKYAMAVNVAERAYLAAQKEG